MFAGVAFFVACCSMPTADVAAASLLPVVISSMDPVLLNETVVSFVPGYVRPPPPPPPPARECYTFLFLCGSPLSILSYFLGSLRKLYCALIWFVLFPGDALFWVEGAVGTIVNHVY